MEYANLNNGVKMPMAGIGTFLLTPDEAEASCVSALQDGYRLIDTANAYVNEKAVGRAMKKSSSLLTLAKACSLQYLRFLYAPTVRKGTTTTAMPR